MPGRNDDLETHIEKCDARHQKQSKEVSQLFEQLSNAQAKLSKMNTRNVNKRLKRKQNTIESLKSQLSEVSEKNNELQQQAMEKDSALENEKTANMEIKHQKHQLQKSKSNLRQKIRNLIDKYASLQEKKEHDTFTLNEELRSKEKEIAHLESIISLMESDVVKTVHDGRYTDEVRECCMSLMSECNVSLNKLPDIIKTVLASFTGKVPERLPSKTLLNWLMAEAKVVASKQVATAMIKDLDLSNTGNVLHQDATTKFHHHYEGAQVTLKDGSTLSIGLKQVAGGDGKTYLNAFKDMVHDLADSLRSDGLEENKAKLICSIKNFMSDQCATNGVFNEGVEELRKNILPAVFQKYEQLNDEERHQINSMGHFACRLHLLANFGIDADKAMSAFESSISMVGTPTVSKVMKVGPFDMHVLQPKL